jgi:hypothetical protein
MPLVGSRPFALAHHGHGAAILVHSIDIYRAGTDHPVDMDQALLPPLAAISSGVSDPPSTKHVE